MFNIGGGELLVIFLVALVVLGPNKLPEAARQVGKMMGEFRKLSTGFQTEMRQAMKDPVGDAVKKAEAELNPEVEDVQALKPAAAGIETLETVKLDDMMKASESDGDDMLKAAKSDGVLDDSRDDPLDDQLKAAQPKRPEPDETGSAPTEESSNSDDHQVEAGDDDVDADPPMFGDR